MNRINILAHDEYDGDYTIGWFDVDKATAYEAEEEYDGDNMVDINAGRHNHQVLYRTAGGRWVLHEWSEWQGSAPTYQFISDEKASKWLLRNHHDEAAEQWFGPIEEERGPGRPEIGPAINTRLPEDLLARLDADAQQHGESRATAIRRILAASLS